MTENIALATFPDYHDARDRGEVVEQSGYHQPQGRRRSLGGGCRCDLDTDKGAYRDVTVRLPNGRVAHFYHQSPVVVHRADMYHLSSHGHKTSTTKERINRYIPSGYCLFQRDFEWYLRPPEADSRTDDSVMDFSDRMTITV
jgi:hypothetical protein